MATGAWMTFWQRSPDTKRRPRSPRWERYFAVAGCCESVLGPGPTPRLPPERPARQRSIPMAKKPTARVEFAFFNVTYEDGSQRSNRKVPASVLDDPYNKDKA